MAKRKAPSKSSPAAAAAAASEAAAVQQQQEEEKKAPETQQQEEEPTKVTVKVEDLEQEDQVNEEEVEEEEEEEAEEEEDENASAEANDDDNEDDEDDESVQKLLEPFTKDQLIELLREAADKHGDVLENIRKLSDTDPVHRKIFVHGLGWDSNSEILIDVFKKYGDIEDCKAVVDKLTGKSKGYAFILFKSRIGAKKALKEPQKKIGSRMTSCQLASAGPVPTQSNVQTAAALMNSSANVSEYTQRKIYVSNVAAEIDPQKLVSFFSKFGEIEEGPLGLDKDTGKPRGFALFVYKSIEGAKKALEEPHKTFEGHVLHCQKAIDGPKPNKQQHNQFQQQQAPSGARPSKFARTDNNSFGGSHSGVTGGHLMAQSGPGIPYNQGASQALNPVLGQALTALLASQGGGGLGLNNILGSFGSTGVGAAGNPAGAPLLNSAMQGGYGNQHMGSGYGSQPGMQGGYSNYQMGGAGRSHKGGYTGGANPYMGR